MPSLVAPSPLEAQWSVSWKSLLGTLRSKTVSRYAYTNNDDFNVITLSRFGVPSDESNQLAEGRKKQEKRDGRARKKRVREERWS